MRSGDQGDGDVGDIAGTQAGGNASP